jgi:hypothetical protein
MTSLPITNFLLFSLFHALHTNRFHPSLRPSRRERLPPKMPEIDPQIEQACSHAKHDTQRTYEQKKNQGEQQTHTKRKRRTAAPKYGNGNAL